jgi:hypothetical protein
MTVFYCTKCSTPLTPDLLALPQVPEITDPDEGRDKKSRRAPSTVPRGHYAIDPEPWGAPFVPTDQPEQRNKPAGRALLRTWSPTPTISAGPRDTIVVHPDDAPQLQPFIQGTNHQGCCGPTGTGGPNLACACGSRLATLAADCIGPCELHLDPVRVYTWEPPTETTNDLA